MNVNMEPAIDPAIAARISTPTDHRLSSDDGGLSVVFSWHTDRYSHVIMATGDRRLNSIEGSTEDDWPVSATISQLSTEIIDGRPTILGVGCSGTTHFSVSVQLDVTGDGDAFIRFDWAARLAKPLTPVDVAPTPADPNVKPLAWLGSTYRIPIGDQSDWSMKAMTNTLIEPDGDESEPRLSLRPTRMDEVRTVEWSYQIKINDRPKG